MKKEKSNAVHVSKHEEEGRAKARPYTVRIGTKRSKVADAKVVWKQVEDMVVPRLFVTTIDHAICLYLMRHSHLEGRRTFRFSIRGLARHVHASDKGTRWAVRRLARQGLLRFVEHSKAGHEVVNQDLPGSLR